MKKKLIFVFVLSFIVILAGCSQDQAVNELSSSEELALFQFKSVEEEPLEMSIGESHTFEVLAKNINGEKIEVKTNWLVDENIATLSNKKNESVTLNAKSPGITELKAEYKGYIAKNKIKIKPNSNKNVYGYVTNGRGGPAVENATVRIEDENKGVKTDENGFFELGLKENVEVDLIVEKEGMAKTRIQSLKITEGEIVELEVPLRSEFNTETWSNIPPEVSVRYSGQDKELKEGDVLQGEVDLDINMFGDNEIYVYYINFSGKQRTPREGFGVESNETTVTIDTTKYNNGENYLRVLAYDTNENAVIYTIPVEISNYPDTPAKVPSRIETIYADSYTFSQNIEMYSQGIESYLEDYNLKENMSIQTDENIINFANGEKLDIEAAPADSMMYIELSWMSVEDAEGYNVYRSFDGVKYEKYATVTMSQLQDYSPQVNPGKKVYYRVRPYNDVGEGEYIERVITPLPSYSVILESPENKSSAISLTPIFEWAYETSGEFPEDTEFFNSVWIYDGTDYIVGGLVEIPTTNVESPVELEPGYIYSWDVFSSHAIRFMDQDENGYSTSYSVSGEYTGDTSGTGSKNGEFIFTTTMDASSEGSVE